MSCDSAVKAKQNSPAQAQETVVLLSKDFDRIKVAQLTRNAFVRKDAAHIDARIQPEGSQSGLYRKDTVHEVMSNILAF
jgi:hypothetical protein